MSTSVTLALSEQEQVELFKRAMQYYSNMWNIFATMNWSVNARDQHNRLDWENEETLYKAAITLVFFTRNNVDYKIDDYIPLEKQDIVKELIAAFNRLEKPHLTPRNHTSW